MLNRRSYEFHIAQPDDFGRMCDALLDRIPADKIIVRLVFFGASGGQEGYLEHLNLIRGKVSLFFREHAPPLSYIAQKPLNGGLLLEVCFMAGSSGQQVDYHHLGDIDYLTIQTGSSRELVIGGVLPEDMNAGTYQQASTVFNIINLVLIRENMPVNSIVRQWNYIEKITGLTGEKTNYLEFNRARTDFYGKTSWENGYPAATGIGIEAGGVVVEIEAVLYLNPSIINIPLNNDFQVPAYRYSGKITAGNEPFRCTPKFERARLISSPGHSFVYVSGTAAIRGEESASGADVIEQTQITIENIFHLVSAENLKASGTGFDKIPEFKVFIIYLKRGSDYDEVKRYMDNEYPTISPVYLQADVCRDELLVEIEAITFLD